MPARAFWSAVVVCALLPAAGRGQPCAAGKAGFCANYGYPYGPRLAPQWSYPGLTGGPFVTYPTLPGFKDKMKPSGLVVYSPLMLDFTSNGLSICGPAVPVYGPVPTVMDAKQLAREWHTMNAPARAGYGWFGLYSAAPRPHHPTVWAWPAANPADVPQIASGAIPVSPPTAPPPASGTGGATGTGATGPAGADKSGADAGGFLTVAVRVPQGAAEVSVDGRPTAQTGTDRTFESPPLPAGGRYTYTVTARWVEGGQVVEVSKAATGAPGDVVRLDFGK
jgi:uncharacterized protein (TIGR03000 family)